MFHATLRLVGSALVFTALLVASSFCDMTQAAMIIVDGTAPGYVLNGSFESGSDGAPVNWRGADGGNNLAADLGINGNMLHRTGLALPSDGSRYTVIGANPGATTVTGVFVNTGYQLALGDTFNLSFFHGEHAANAAGSLEGDETFEWRLFTTTTNTNAGIVDTVLAFDTVNSHNSFTLTEVSLFGVGAVTASSVGKSLFLAFIPVTADADFFALDQVNLSVVPVPEPSAVLLFACAMATLHFVRRRRQHQVRE
jgi:hypothetical protein